MRFPWKKRKDKTKWSEGRKTLEPNFSATIELKGNSIKNDDEKSNEYEIVECVIYPEKIICPDCGGLTLEGLDYCDKCGGEIHDMGDQGPK